MLINVCTLSDNNYAQHLGVMIASVLLSAKTSDQLKFHVLDGGINEKNKKYIEKLKEIKDFEITYYLVNNTDLVDCPTTYLPIASYYNFLPQKYLLDIDRVVFLDSDMIILESLEEIYSIDIGDNVIAGCEDAVSEKNKLRLEIPSKYFYFNTGTMVMDLKAWREQDILTKLLKYVVDYPEKIKYMDQDVLNAVLYKQSFKLPLKWNSVYYPYGHTYASDTEYEEALSNPSIIHYAMSDKPWLLESKIPRKEYYWSVFRATPWNNNKNIICWFAFSCIKISLRSIRHFFKFRFVFKPIERYIKTH